MRVPCRGGSICDHPPVRFGLCLVVFGAACQAPSIGLAPGDASVSDGEAAVDARTCAKVRAPDGGVCGSPFDEDGDCTPDECDDCPNVPQEPIPSSRGIGTAGRACTHVPPFDTITRRVAFQGFAHDLLPWLDPDDAFGDERLAFHDGYATVGRKGGSERAILLDLGLGTRDVVVSATLRLPSGGTTGLLLRASVAKPHQSYVCLVQNAVFGVWAMTCDAGACNGRFLPSEAGVASKSVPGDVEVDRGFYLRGAVQTLSSTRARLGCQIFPRPETSDDVARTLASLLTSEHTVVVETDVMIASGESGLATGGSAVVIDSYDVLASP